MIYKVFKYYYFRLYRWYSKTFGAEDLPILNTLLTLSFFSYIHFLIIVLLLEKFLKTPVFSIFQGYRPLTLLTMFIILGINYFLFIFGGKTKKVVAEFEELSSAEIKRLKRISILYLLSVVLIFISSVVLFVA